MQSAVRILFDEGRLLPRWREGGLPNYKGIFIIEDSFDDVFKRTMTFARLIRLPGESGDPYVIPCLKDARVLVMKDDWLRVAGLEFHEVGKKNTYQTWHVELLPPQ